MRNFEEGDENVVLFHRCMDVVRVFSESNATLDRGLLSRPRTAEALRGVCTFMNMNGEEWYYQNLDCVKKVFRAVAKWIVVTGCADARKFIEKEARYDVYAAQQSFDFDKLLAIANLSAKMAAKAGRRASQGKRGRAKPVTIQQAANMILDLHPGHKKFGCRVSKSCLENWERGKGKPPKNADGTPYSSVLRESEKRFRDWLLSYVDEISAEYKPAKKSALCLADWLWEKRNEKLEGCLIRRKG